MILIVAIDDVETHYHKTDTASISENFYRKLKEYHNKDVEEFGDDDEFFEQLSELQDNHRDIKSGEILEVYIIWTV